MTTVEKPECPPNPIPDGPIHWHTVSKSRNVNKGGYWECMDCGKYLNGFYFGDGEPGRDVDTRAEAVELGIA